MALLTRIGAAALLLWGLEAAPALAQEGRVGEIADRKALVKGRRGNAPQTELNKGDRVFVGMKIQTFAGAGALIAINRDLQQQRGSVTLGPKTIVELTERLVNEAGGLVKMSWLVKLGQFRLALFPPPPGAPLREGEYMIRIPGPNGTEIEIRLQGTDVAVQVDKNGTATIWVMEGEVTVTAADGGVIQVPAGYSTRVQPGREPEQPAHVGRAAGPAPGVAPRPGETIFSNPPRLDLQAIRLDLPF